MMSYLTYLLAGCMFMHKIWPGEEHIRLNMKTIISQI